MHLAAECYSAPGYCLVQAAAGTELRGLARFTPNFEQSICFSRPVRTAAPPAGMFVNGYPPRTVKIGTPDLRKHGWLHHRGRKFYRSVSSSLRFLLFHWLLDLFSCMRVPCLAE